MPAIGESFALAPWVSCKSWLQLDANKCKYIHFLALNAARTVPHPRYSMMVVNFGQKEQFHVIYHIKATSKPFDNVDDCE